MIDSNSIKAGTRIKMEDGQVLTVTGAYMSVEGLVFRGKADPGNLCERNCPLALIVEVIQEATDGTGT